MTRFLFFINFLLDTINILQDTCPLLIKCRLMALFYWVIIVDVGV